MRRLRTPAALLLATLVMAGNVAWAQSPRASDRARESYHHGQALFDQHRYSDALQAFRDSLAQLDSPNTRLYIARSLREMDHPAEAWLEFDRAARDAEVRSAHDPRYADTRLNAVAERDALAPRVGLVRIVVDATLQATQTIVNGRPLAHDESAGPIPVAPGVVQVTVHTASGRDLTRVVEITAGGRQQISFAPEASSPEARPSGPVRPVRVTGLVAASVGLLALAGGAIAGGLDAAQFHSLQQSCGAGPCPPNYGNDVARGEAEQFAANALFIGGGIILAGGAVLLVADALMHRGTSHAGVAVLPSRNAVTIRVEF